MKKLKPKTGSPNQTKAPVGPQNNWGRYYVERTKWSFDGHTFLLLGRSPVRGRVRSTWSSHAFHAPFGSSCWSRFIN